MVNQTNLLFVVLLSFLMGYLLCNQFAMAQTQPESSFCYTPTTLFTENYDLVRYCYNVGGIIGSSVLISYDSGNSWHLATNGQLVDISEVETRLPPFLNNYLSEMMKISNQVLECAVSNPIYQPDGEYDPRYLECINQAYCPLMKIYDPQVNAFCDN